MSDRLGDVYSPSLDGKLMWGKGFKTITITQTRNKENAKTAETTRISFVLSFFRDIQVQFQVSAGRGIQMYKHPRTEVRGRFRRYTSRRSLALELGGVFGGDPLMPVLLHRVLVVGRPQIGPEPDRFGRRRAALDDDP
jgi:hypothetical protein